MNTERQIVDQLVRKWLAHAREFSKRAPDIRGIYVYSSSEHGVSQTDIIFDQGGFLKYPVEVQGTKNAPDATDRLSDHLHDYLHEANIEFARIKVAHPTEYRVFYDTISGKVETNISYELIYTDNPQASDPIWGFVNWLGERAPRPY